MRLNEKQLKGILLGLRSVLQDSKGILKLYGSRARTELKGGDIDLCWITTTDEEAQNLQTKIIPILMAIKINIGEQKIDFSIISERQSKEDPFWKSSLEHSIELLRRVS